MGWRPPLRTRAAAGCGPVRNGNDMTPSYPELEVLAGQVSVPVSWTARSSRSAAAAPTSACCSPACTSGRPAADQRRAGPPVPVRHPVRGRRDAAGMLIPPAASGSRVSAWTPVRSVPRRGIAAGRPTCWPPAWPTAWKAWSASRWPRPIILASAGAGSRSRTSGMPRSSSAAGNPAGAAGRHIGSLLLGVPDDGQLRYAGHVGTGFTQAMLTDLARQLRVCAAPPARSPARRPPGTRAGSNTYG